jgi:ring-1,2-phenylacetyl-CoA epoxidase subunit PaaE
MNTFSLKVCNIKYETQDAVTLCFKPPVLRKLRYIAGQYLTLILRINGKRYLRSYSFSSAPDVDSYIEVTVKRVNDGVVSNFINDQVKIDDIIEVLPPMGDFVFSENCSQKSVFLWGVGSGISPLFSIMKKLLSIADESKVNLIYGNKTIESTIFWNQLLDLERRFQNRLRVWHFHTMSEEDNSAIYKGRIQPEIVFSNYDHYTIQNSIHFICGPVGFKDNIRSFLSTYDVVQSDVLFEDFQPHFEIKNVENIENRTVLINFNNVQREAFIPKGKSILEGALDSGIEIPYSCRTGNCSMCKGILKQGELKLLGLIDQREDQTNKEFLMCCSYPLTDNVVVEFYD